MPSLNLIKNLIQLFHGTFKKKNNNILLSIGEYDDPENQKQGLAVLNLSKDGNAIIYGNAESGKETLISTMIYDLMTNYTTDEVWMYILDFGTEALRIFNACPHVGEVILANDGEKLSRLFIRIKEIISERKQILTEYNGDYNFFLKESNQSMPLIIIFLNEYDNFIENYHDLFDDTLLTLTREGLKTGVIFIMSTNASGDLRYRMGQNFKQKIALSLNDISDYNNIYDSVRNRHPAHKFGRGFVNLNDEVFEFQTAKPCAQEEYNVFIKDAIEKVKAENKKEADHIPILPEIVKIEDFNIDNLELSNIPIGLRKKDIKPEFYDFKNNLINIITAKDAEDSFQFASNILQKTNEIDTVEKIVLDSQRKILSGKNDFEDNYKKLIKLIEKKSTKFSLCFIFGLDKFINQLEEIKRKKNNNDDDDYDDYSDNSNEIESIINKCEKNKNVSFIIVDSSEKIKEHNYDDWYKNNVTEHNVIWVGNGIEDQYIMNVEAPRKERINNCGCSFGYINKNSRTFMLKLLEMKERREDDE